MELFYRKYGDGYPFIILHGLFGSSDNWIPLAKKLEKDFSVYLLDARNHGQSPHKRKHNYDVMVGDVYDFCKQQGISCCNILGHSMGGKAAMKFAANYPEMVSKLVVADISPLKKELHSSSYQDILKIIEVITSLKLNKFKSFNELGEYLSLQIADVKIVWFILKNINKNGRKFEWKFNLNGLVKNLPTIGDAVNVAQNVETLFVRSDTSGYIEDEDIEYINNSLSNVQIKTLKGAGHWVHAEKPNEFLELVQDFIYL